MLLHPQTWDPVLTMPLSSNMPLFFFFPLLLHLPHATLPRCGWLEEEELLGVLKNQASFNPRFQAVSVEAAAVTFPDLSGGEEEGEELYGEKCEEKMRERARLMEEAGFSLNSSHLIDTCEPEPTSTEVPSTSAHPFPYLRKVSLRPDIISEHLFRKRSRRQTSSSTEDTVRILSCRKPNTENEAGRIPLCGVCSGIRVLPTNFFPRYVNQAVCCPPHICPHNHRTCLAGHGLCIQKYINFDVLFNSGSEECPQWRPMSLSIPVCCDCNLRSSSPLGQLLKAVPEHTSTSP